VLYAPHGLPDSLTEFTRHSSPELRRRNAFLAAQAPRN